jgi:hypothetical protein
MPYFDDLVFSEIISYCGLKPVEDRLTVGVYSRMKRCEYPEFERGYLHSTLFFLRRRTEKYAWVSHQYFGDGWSEPRRIKIRHINGQETLRRGKMKGLAITPKCKLDTLFTKSQWYTLTPEEKLERYLKKV